jgi:hypothetical protein
MAHFLKKNAKYKQIRETLLKYNIKGKQTWH